MGDSFGTLFKATTWGESHGGGVGVVIDGCPAGMELAEADLQRELDRRKPGQSRITTQRKESDRAQILSGVFEGKTLGTAISVLVLNEDARSEDYQELKDLYRPSHADFTYQRKYGLRNWKGGGRASARETVGRVAAGAVAKKLLTSHFGIRTLAFVSRVRDIQTGVAPDSVTEEQVEASIIRCPDPPVAERMIGLVEEVRNKGDSLGGIVTAIVHDCPPGLGEPVFDKLTADLAKGLMSLPASRGVEFGLGFEAVNLTGSTHNDIFVMRQGKVRTETNRSGGIQGGISNGEQILLRVAFKPTATIRIAQRTVTVQGEETEIRGRGRHDPCVLPRAVPMVEAMINLVLIDHLLRTIPRGSLAEMEKIVSEFRK